MLKKMLTIITVIFSVKGYALSFEEAKQSLAAEMAKPIYYYDNAKRCELVRSTDLRGGTIVDEEVDKTIDLLLIEHGLVSRELHFQIVDLEVVNHLVRKILDPVEVAYYNQLFDVLFIGHSEAGESLLTVVDFYPDNQNSIIEFHTYANCKSISNPSL